MAGNHKLSFCLTMCISILLAGWTTNAEESSSGVLQDLKNQAIQAISKELVKQVKKHFIDQAIPEPETTKNPKSVALPAGGTPVSGPGSARSDLETMAMLAAIANQVLQSREIETRGCGVVINNAPREITPEEKPLRTGAVMVITSTNIPIKALTVKQARMIFAGEYTNWSQVGGPDIPIKVVICQTAAAELGNLMNAPVANDAMMLRYAGLMVPAVDRINGSIGFITTLSVDQVEFINRHKALQKLAVKANDGAPGVTPSVGAIYNGSYPITVDRINMQQPPTKKEQDSVKISANY